MLMHPAQSVVKKKAAATTTVLNSIPALLITPLLSLNSHQEKQIFIIAHYSQR
jgi:hypothetical protein